MPTDDRYHEKLRARNDSEPSTPENASAIQRRWANAAARQLKHYANVVKDARDLLTKKPREPVGLPAVRRQEHQRAAQQAGRSAASLKTAASARLGAAPPEKNYSPSKTGAQSTVPQTPANLAPPIRPNVRAATGPSSDRGIPR